MMINNENINTSPGKTARPRERSSNPFHAKILVSPSKGSLYKSDEPHKAPAKRSSPRRDGDGAPQLDLRSPYPRSSPLAPVSANNRVTLRPAQDRAPESNPAPLSLLRRPWDKTDGLRLHWDDAATCSAAQRATPQSGTDRSSYEQDSESRHQSAFLSAQDLSIPDLRDTDITPLDSDFLLSPFTMSEPTFDKPAARAYISEEEASPAVHANLACSSSTPLQPVNTTTPTSPPRRAFFRTDSAGSFSRFPTPDKVTVGFTPSPVQSDCLPPSGPRVVPIPPGVPILANDNSLLRSASSQTMQSDSTFVGSVSASSSATGISDIATCDLPWDQRMHSTTSTLVQSRNGISRSDIRASLLNFPSPPTSPRLGKFVRAASPILPAGQSGEPTSSFGASTSTTRSFQIYAPHGSYRTDDLQSSIDELLADASREGHSLLPSRLDFPSLSQRSASMPPGHVQIVDTCRKQPSTSLPPNMELPPLPPISHPSHGQDDSPVQEIPSSGEASLTASYIRPILPLRTPQVAGAPTLEADKAPFGTESAHVISAPNQPNTTADRNLTPSESTENFLIAKASQVTPAQRPPLPTSNRYALDEMSKKTCRRRTSLSIRIPKIFSKSRKLDDNAPSQSATSQNSLQLPQSRFSPDSDGPTPVSEKAPVNIFKRLSRAASSPNLKANATAEAAVSRQNPHKVHFVTPASAPPVPTANIQSVRADASNGTPLPTPSLVTDIESSMGGDSPRPGGTGEHDCTFARMQNYNPYFPKFPASQSSLVVSTVELKDSQSPHSPQDVDRVNPPPGNASSKPAPIPEFSDLHNKPVTTLAASDTYYSDSGSASMAREDPTRTAKASAVPGPTGSRRSTLSGSSNGDDGDEDEDDAYGGRCLSSDEYYTSSDNEDDESEDDDVPLAETHPDALTAQNSLRAKVRGDQAKKKKRPAEAGGTKISAATNPETSALELQSPSTSMMRQPLTERASHAKPVGPPVIKCNPFGFEPDELSEKLRHLDASHGRLSSLRHPPKRPDSSGERPHDLLLPQTDEHVKHRSSKKGRGHLAPPLAPFVQDSVLTMSEGSDDGDVAPLRIRKKPQAVPRPVAIPSAQVRVRQTSSEASSIPASPRSPSINQHEQSFSAFREAAPAPGYRSVPPAHHHHGRPTFRSKQRVYINDPQHHCSVEVDENMTAAKLLAHLRGKNAISANPAWSVTEVWRVMGVERPLREYELIQESIESWSSEANSSLLLVKKSPLAPLLSSLSKAGNDSETKGGWVYLEVKHGKWSKRYIEVRSGALYIGKSEKQRDLTLLCHFSNFDAYIVPQACLAKMKTPKPYAFAVKSVDKVSLFENADQDYIHFFSVKTEAERDAWLQHILESRSKLVKQIAVSRAAASAHDTRSNLMGQQIGQHQQYAKHQVSQHHTVSTNTSSNMSRSASSKTHTPPMPSQATFGGDQSMLARRPSNAHPMSVDPKKIISADNLPPLPGALPSGQFATLPQGRQWERLAPEDKRAIIQEASRKARDGGKALLDFGETQESAGLLGRARAKSLGQRR